MSPSDPSPSADSDDLLSALSQSLRTAEEWRATLIDAIESISEAFGLFDADDRLILCNRRYAQTFTDYDNFAAIAGWHFTDLVRASVAKGEIIEPAFAGDTDAWIAERARRHRFPGGSQRQIQLGDGTWLQISERPTRGGGIVGVRTDITALKGAQHAAEAANESKTRFLRTMSHEIRTPMNGVLGMAQLLADTRLDSTQARYVETIEQSGRHLLAIINDILDFSKVESGQIELEEAALDLAALVRESALMLASAAQAKGLELVVDIDPSVAFKLLGDPLRLQQIIINLVNNAIKFTETGGVIVSLRAGLGQADRLLVDLSVTDSGPGIEPHLHEKIFDHFAQADGSTARKYGGTGLGLAICRQLAHLMGGDITLESAPGGGSTFHLSVALQVIAEMPPVAPDKPVAPRGAALPQMRGRVLLAEDNEVNRTIVMTLLARIGLTTVHAVNGAEAVAQMRDGAFDLILMDCQMPEMDGFTATEEIRALEAQEGRRPIPIIALTANAMEGDRDSCLQAGMNDYLTKPFKGSQLAEMLQRWLPSGAVETQEQVTNQRAAFGDLAALCQDYADHGRDETLAAIAEKASLLLR